MSVTAFWIRRDLRLDDNTALYHALTSGQPVVPVFIFDREILDELPKNDARVDFIYRTLVALDAQLRALGSALVVRYGSPMAVWKSLVEEFSFTQIHTNHDYEPYARERDAHLADFFKEAGAGFYTYKDQVIFEKEEVMSNTGTAYSVFTPYSRKWLAQLTEAHLADIGTEAHFAHFWKPTTPVSAIPTLESMGFARTEMAFPSQIADEEIIRLYSEKRDFPAEKGTSHLGLHLRFGTISIRKLAKTARTLNATFLNELIWREFYAQILWNYPHVAHRPFRAEYEALAWLDDPKGLVAWQEGRTGYPLVDAGMRELNATGFMHNRVRMVVASFLTKHLLIDYRLGEAYFAEKLLDFELASNNGGWQWAAGCGCDAAPYFRVFNPTAQMEKFDKGLRYIRKWVPEYGTPAYPRPIVEHTFARERVLAAYQKALKPAQRP